METPLLAALGDPPLGRPVPGSGSDEWRQRRCTLQRALEALGRRAVLRTSQSLWRALGPPVAAMRWEQLAPFKVGNLLALLAANAPGTVKLVSWNIRWFEIPTPKKQRGRWR